MLTASRNDPKVLVRLPAPLLKQVDASARSSGRSRNTQIIALLSEMLDGNGANGKVSAAFAGKAR